MTKTTLKRAFHLFMAALLLAALAACERGKPEGNKTFEFTKDTEVSAVRPPRPVRIELRRMSDGTYNWKVTGEDAGEIIRADAELRAGINNTPHGAAKPQGKRAAGGEREEE